MGRIFKRTRFIKKLLLILIILLSFSKANALEIKSEKVLLINLNDNQILIDKNSEEKTSIASLTKIMTTLVAIENIDNLEETVKITHDMFDGLAEENLYQVGLKIFSTPSYNDLLHATLISSGADATRALTNKYGDIKFVEMMNKKAKELKLKDTHFSNTIGIDDENHYSTLKDVKILLEYALKNKKFKEIFETKKYVFSDNSITIESSIKKTGEYFNINTSHIKGGKTGYTFSAGRCLASIATDEKNNINYMLITTNALESPNHIIDALTIYDYYFENYKYYEIVNKQDVIKKIQTKYSKTKEIKLKVDENITLFYDKSFDKKLIKIEYKGLNIVKPNDDIIGKIKIYYDKKLLYEKEYDNNIEFSIFEFIKSYIFIIIPIILIVSFIFITKTKKLN